MKISITKKKLIMVFLVFFLVFGEIGSSEITFCIGLVFLFYCILKYKLNIRAVKYILPLLMILLAGCLVGSINYSVTNRDFVRDIFKTAGPIIYILIGFYMQGKLCISTENIVTIFNYSALIITVRHFVLKLVEILQFGFNFNMLRTVGGNCSIIVLTIIGILIFFEKLPPKINKNKSKLLTLYITSLLLYLSRTAIVGLIILLVVYFLLHMKNPKNIAYIIGVIVTVIILFNVLPSDLTEPLLTKFNKSIVEVSYDTNTWNFVSINNNWRAYEIYRIKHQFEGTSILTRLFGFGFGKSINLGFSINLGGTQMNSISIFHNAYYYIYLKCGIIGAALFVAYYLREMTSCFIRAKYNKNLYGLLVSIYLIVIFMSYVIMGIYNGSYLIGFCLICGYLSSYLNGKLS